MKRMSKRHLFLLVSLCGMLLGWSASAQTCIRYIKPEDIGTKALYADSVLTSITLPRGVARLNNYPKFNVAALELYEVLQDPTKDILQVWVCGSASPDGLWGDNVKLSQARTDAAVAYLKSIIDIPDWKIHKESLNEDWDRLAELVEASDIPYKWEVLYIIRTKEWGERKTALQKLDGGRVWKILEKDFFPQLRCVRFAIYCRWDPTKPHLSAPVEEPVMAAEEPAKADTVYVRDTVFMMRETVYMTPEPPVTEEDVYEEYREKSLRQKKVWDTPWMAGVKTNLVSDALAVPSVGVEVQLGRSLSFDLQGWKTDFNIFNTKDQLASFYGFAPELRLWFGGSTMRKGSFIGLHGRCAWYTLQWTDGLLYQNGPDNVWHGNFHNAGNRNPAWCAGFTYGYSLGFGQKKHWGLEFVLGLGYANYAQNTAAFNGGIWEYREHQAKHHFGITKAQINLTYRFSLRRVDPSYYENN